MSVFIEPMKAQPATNVPLGPGWLAECKYDGWRGGLRKNADGTTELFSATGKPITSTPYILKDKLIERAPVGIVLDGEMVNLSGANHEQWNLAQSICSREYVHVPSAEEPALTFMVFDVLEMFGNDDVRTQPLERRKQLLQTLFDLADVGEGEHIKLVPDVPCTEESLAELVGEGWEGVVCKRTDSLYQPGRSPAWVKIKPNFEIEVTCTGMFPPEAGSKYEGKAVGGFTFSVTHPDGRTFEGRCGTGISDDMREMMKACPNDYVGRVVELKHWGVQPDTGALRFPSLKRFRDPADKAVAETQVVAEMSVSKLEAIVPEPVTPTNPTVSQSWALERMVDLESENKKLTAEVAKLRIQLDATLRGATVPNGGGAQAQATGTRTRRLRNYKAMSNDKLEACLIDLQQGHGPNYEEAVQRGDPTRAKSVVERIARERGLI